MLINEFELFDINRELPRNKTGPKRFTVKPPANIITYTKLVWVKIADIITVKFDISILYCFPPVMSILTVTISRNYVRIISNKSLT